MTCDNKCEESSVKAKHDLREGEERPVLGVLVGHGQEAVDDVRLRRHDQDDDPHGPAVVLQAGGHMDHRLYCRLWGRWGRMCNGSQV